MASIVSRPQSVNLPMKKSISLERARACSKLPLASPPRPKASCASCAHERHTPHSTQPESPPPQPQALEEKRDMVNKACCPSGHYWNCYTGALSLGMLPWETHLELLTLFPIYSNYCNSLKIITLQEISAQIANFMGPTWGPPGSCQPQMGPMLAPSTLLLGWVPELQMSCRDLSQ